jgi:hypothetical protein
VLRHLAKAVDPLTQTQTLDHGHALALFNLLISPA